MSPLNGSEVDAGIASLKERYVDLLARDADARASNHSANAKLTKIHAQVVQSRASLNNHQSGLPFSDWRKSLKSTSLERIIEKRNALEEKAGLGPITAKEHVEVLNNYPHQARNLQFTELNHTQNLPKPCHEIRMQASRGELYEGHTDSYKQDIYSVNREHKDHYLPKEKAYAFKKKHYLTYKSIRSGYELTVHEDGKIVRTLKAFASMDRDWGELGYRGEPTAVGYARRMVDDPLVGIDRPVMDFRINDGYYRAFYQVDPAVLSSAADQRTR